MSPSKPLNVAVYQSALADASPDHRLRSLDKAIETHGSGIDLVVCPELFLSGYGAGEKLVQLSEPRGGPFAGQVGEIARKHGCCVVYGYPEAAHGGIYNAAAVIGKDGSIVANHRKMVLPTSYEKQWFRRGDSLTTFELHGWQVAVVVCYEVEFPEIVRACAVRGADLVVVPTALTREWDLVARQLVPARAFENGVYIAYSNHGGVEGDTVYLGESCIVGPDGRDLARAGSKEEVIGAVLDPAVFAALRSRLGYLADSSTLTALRSTGMTTTANERLVASPT